MTNLNHILTEIAGNKQIKAAAKNVCGELWEDLIHEVCLQVIEKPDKLTHAFENGYLINYICRILIFQNNDRYSRFNKIYHPEKVSSRPVYLEEFDSERHEVENETIDHDWIDKRDLEVLKTLFSKEHGKMVADYVKIGNYRDLGKHYGISHKRVWRRVAKTISEVKEECKKVA